jgi:ABC-type glutathione transport system ATPase component
VEFSELESFIDTPVKRYSSGMYVRLGFSVAAHIEPDVLLVDEVLAVGDAQFRQKCAGRIDELRKLGTTIVFVAHNLYLVKSVCDSAIYMNHGQIQIYGDTVEAINAYEKWMFVSQIQKSNTLLDEQGPNNSSAARITAVEIRRLNGAIARKFRHGEAVEIQVHYESKKLVHQPNLVLRITRSDGITCFMVRTNDYGYRFDNLQGKGVISVAVEPLQLASGAYTIEAKLMMTSIDGVPLASKHSRWFEVEGLSLGYEEISGVYVPHVKWARLEEDCQSKVLEQR